LTLIETKQHVFDLFQSILWVLPRLPWIQQGRDWHPNFLQIRGEGQPWRRTYSASLVFEPCSAIVMQPSLHSPVCPVMSMIFYE
jgi:hypothetical protein